jgi:hypothetical protein
MGEGTRSGLWSEFAKAIEVIRPRWVVIENVRGLLSAKAGSDLEQCAWCMGETGNGEPLCEHSELYSETWQTSGMMREWHGVRASVALWILVRVGARRLWVLWLWVMFVRIVRGKRDANECA